MKLLLTGICGFVGSTLAKSIVESGIATEIIGIDNLSRSGSYLNRQPLLDLGVEVRHGDIRNQSDVDALPQCDFLIDAAANPSVLAGVDGKTSSRQLIEHNLAGTINLLEYCKQYSAGFILLSTSRVYAIPGLAGLRMTSVNDAFNPQPDQVFPHGISVAGVSETYTTLPPVSLYGSTKVTSEQLALEYGATFDFPVWINRCGVMAGAGQFGHPAQGIFAYWIHAFREHQPLKYIGFGSSGHQVRDCLHPHDLVPLLQKQFAQPLSTDQPRIVNVGGGVQNSISLAQLTRWCQAHFPHSSTSDSQLAARNSPLASPNRPFDVPWIVLDANLCQRAWDWEVKTSIESVLHEIAAFAKENGNWLKVST